MIGYLRGRVVEKNSEGVIIDVSGVGYDLQCSMNTIDALDFGTDVQVWVQTYIREEALNLFGFATPVEKRMFLSLLKVNGVGPKMALKILSGSPLDKLVETIEAGNAKALSALPKVGKKTAEQIILTLKGKLVLADEGGAGGRKGGVREDIISALVNLGFRLQEVEKVVGDMPADIDVQQGVRQGLQALSSL